MLVARGSDVMLSKGYGLAHVEWDVPSSPSARRVDHDAVTATAILLLEERGWRKVTTS